MRTIGLALLALAFTASPATAAVIEFEEHFCGCDPSSGDEDTIGIIVRAASGELNRMTVRQMPRGILIQDEGATLTGRCRPSPSGGRFCRGTTFDGVAVYLDDGDDRIRSDFGGLFEGGEGADEITGSSSVGGHFQFSGGPGADRFDATDGAIGTVLYADHTEGVTVRLNGLADDGAPGEGDIILGNVTGMVGGSGDDTLEAGPNGSALSGGGGNDTLLGSPQHDGLNGGDGEDQLIAGDGDDHLVGGAGADVLSGGPGLDEASYGGSAPLHLSIGDGANDGAAGEGDDIREDVESLIGGSGSDVLVGDDDGNQLIAYGGRDVLRGLGGGDRLVGWNDGDELDAGAGPDIVEAGALDLPLLADGEADRLNCRSRAPAIAADDLDLIHSCAPRVYMKFRPRVQPGGRIAMRARCPRESTVPCQGRVWLRLRGGRHITRAVRFGPVEPGALVRVQPRLRVRPRRGACISATAVTNRKDGIRTSTITRSAFTCLG
jgi:RTX calcium-binding nonapeptide repeat (4 copies)